MYVTRGQLEDKSSGLPKGRMLFARDMCTLQRVEAHAEPPPGRSCKRTARTWLHTPKAYFDGAVDARILCRPTAASALRALASLNWQLRRPADVSGATRRGTSVLFALGPAAQFPRGGTRGCRRRCMFERRSSPQTADSDGLARRASGRGPARREGCARREMELDIWRRNVLARRRVRVHAGVDRCGRRLSSCPEDDDHLESAL